MENFLCEDTLNKGFTFAEDNITCDYGELEFSIEQDEVILNSISVYAKRMGVGKSLDNKLEYLVKLQGFKIIVVPASPTKEAVSFWKKIGYNHSDVDDKYWINKIILSDKETPWATSQGVVVMIKHI